MHISGDGERASVLVATDDPHGRGFSDSYTSRRELLYYRIGNVSAMDRALARVDMVPGTHTLSVQVEYMDVTEYC